MPILREDQYAHRPLFNEVNVSSTCSTAACDNQFIAGDEYTIADMANLAWYGNGMLIGASSNDPRTFLQTHDIKT